MALSGVAAATRAFVTLLLFLANRYHLVLHINRDSAPDELAKAFRKVMVKAHPDKGGSKEDAQRLTAARDAWNDARKSSGSGGRRPESLAVGGGPFFGPPFRLFFASPSRTPCVRHRRAAPKGLHERDAARSGHDPPERGLQISVFLPGETTTKSR